MKAQFIDHIVSSPWGLDKLRGRNIIGHMVTTLLKSERPAEDIFGDPLPKIQILGDVAIIPISGILMMAVPTWLKEWGFGITDANDIEEELDQALSNADVQFTVLDVNSPGGLSLAGEKLFSIVEAANRRKPVFGFCGDGHKACSSAYQAIAPTRATLAGPFASAIGNVGTYLAYLDDTDYWAKLGIKFKVFRSGEYKGIGEDALSEEQANYLQSIVDETGARFRRQVKTYRTGIADEDLQGQWFTGEEAARRGFIAGNAKDLSAAVARFRKML